MTAHNTFMAQAIELAKTNSVENGGPFGAVVVKDNQIIGQASNQVLKNHDPSAHAEILAIRMACQHEQNHCLKETILYASCEPCPMCLSAIYWAKIPCVYFAASREDAAAIEFQDESLYQELALPLEQRSVRCQQVMHEEATAAMNAWYQKENHKNY